MRSTGVRNYQARNLMRDDMQVGDGVAQLASGAYADPTQWEPQSLYFDPTSKPEALAADVPG